MYNVHVATVLILVCLHVLPHVRIRVSIYVCVCNVIGFFPVRSLESIVDTEMGKNDVYFYYIKIVFNYVKYHKFHKFLVQL